MGGAPGLVAVECAAQIVIRPMAFKLRGHLWMVHVAVLLGTPTGTFGSTGTPSVVKERAGGNIPGRLVNPLGLPKPNVVTSINQAGANTVSSGFGSQRTSNSETAYGIFYWAGLPEGMYSQVVAETDAFGVVYRSNISVPASGDATFTVLQQPRSAA